jgi:hypothetical protein
MNLKGIMEALRHRKAETSLHYVQAEQGTQRNAQSSFLDAVQAKSFKDGSHGGSHENSTSL